jgi:hypothetical protein
MMGQFLIVVPPEQVVLLKQPIAGNSATEWYLCQKVEAVPRTDSRRFRDTYATHLHSY